MLNDAAAEKAGSAEHGNGATGYESPWGSPPTGPCSPFSQNTPQLLAIDAHCPSGPSQELAARIRSQRRTSLPPSRGKYFFDNFFFRLATSPDKRMITSCS